MKSLLIDMDGVLRLGNQPAPDVIPFFNFIAEQKIPTCILSNTTLHTGNSIRLFFEKQGVNLQNIGIQTALDATVSYVKKHYQNPAIYVHPNAEHAFKGIELKPKSPDAIVIGDLGNGWTYELLNEILNHTMNGADLIAMHVNRYWKHPDKGVMVDAGLFVKGLEYATSKTAILIGKPSPLFFQGGLELAGTPNDKEFIMLGDDISGDVHTAQKIGGKGVLILTGKTNIQQAEVHECIPDFICEDLMSFIEWIRKEI